MKKIGVMIRKWDDFNKNSTNPTRKNLHKQVLTLHRKIQKKDKILTEYSIEIKFEQIQKMFDDKE